MFIGEQIRNKVYPEGYRVFHDQDKFYCYDENEKLINVYSSGRRESFKSLDLPRDGWDDDFGFLPTFSIEV